VPFVRPLPALRPLGEDAYELVEPLHYVTDAGDLFTVGRPDEDPYITDLATVPRPARALVPCSGLHTYPSILHDRRCDDLNAGRSALTSREVDREFRHAMRSLGVKPLRRWVMWAGVRLGAVASSTRREDWFRADALGVLAIVVAVAPLYLPVLLLNAVAQHLDSAAGWVALAACRALHEHDEATLLPAIPVAVIRERVAA
jgi:hypothetical protein